MCRFLAFVCIICADLLFSSYCLAGTLTPYPVRPPVGLGWPSNPKDLIIVNGKLLFFAFTAPSTMDPTLWVSDGTANGTVEIYRTAPEWNEVYYRKFTKIGSTLYFSGSRNAYSDVELWKSDGTSEGTAIVSDIYPGSGSSSPSYLTDVNGTLFFVAGDGAGKKGVWKSDGTTSGTEFIGKVSISSISASEFVNVGGTLYFPANDNFGAELWKSDGTAGGTAMVADINPSGPSAPAELTAVGNELYFTALSDSRQHIWKTDGTVAGTVKLTDRFRIGGLDRPTSLVNVGADLFFTAFDRSTGTELYTSDGTEAGTAMVRDIYPGTFPPDFMGGEGNSSDPQNLTNINGTLYFTANDGVHGRELWKSDGTAAGTSMVIDLTPGSASTGFYYNGFTISSCEFLAVSNHLFFTAITRSTSGTKFDHSLYVTDGTAEGTSEVFTFSNIGMTVPLISELTFDGQRLYFRAAINYVGSGVPNQFALFAVDVVPEPTALGLLVFGLCGISAIRRSSTSCQE